MPALRGLPVLLLLALVLSASACLGGARSGTVLGVVVVEGGPLPQPAQSDGRPVDSAPLVVRGRTQSGHVLVRRLTADGRGRFRLTLPPGRYRITAPIFGNVRGPHRRVVVHAGRTLHVRLVGDVI